MVLKIGFLDMNYEISIWDLVAGIRMPFKAPVEAFKACWRIGEGDSSGEGVEWLEWAENQPECGENR